MPVDYKTPAAYRAPALPPLPAVPTLPQPTAAQLQAAYNAFHPAAPAPVSYPTPDLTPEDVNYFDTAGQQATQAWGHGIAQNNYTGQQQLLSHNQQMQALNQRYDETRRRLPGSFIKRGIGQSGIAAQGYQDFNRDRAQGIGAENLRYQTEVGQNQITADQLSDVWKSTTEQIKAQRDARQKTILAAAARNK